ncbi:MAG: molybdopterin-dependent oxidoreductase [Anaerolineales bacterium]|nr:molybdopterin-dependent oxidoreductase [Anaerolineales bacterium]
MSKLNRRDFLRLTAVAGGSALAWSGVQALLDPKPAHASTGRVTTSAEDVIVPGVCALCPSGCGVMVRVADGNVVKLEGNPMHPINLGVLCPKGQAAPELLYNPDRLTAPMKRTGERGAGKWQEISWDEAAQLVAEQLQAARDAGHPESVALLHGQTRGQQRSFFDRFMKAVGSPNLVSHESLNVAAAKLGMYLTQGTYALPAYDLENSNYILAFGASLLEGGPNPQRMVSGVSYGRQGRSNRNKVVLVDPRQGVTGAKADEWIPIKPGTDAALALVMANVIIRSNLFDSDFIHNYSFGFDDFTGPDGKTHKGFKNFVLENYDPRQVEQITGVSATTIARMAGEFATTKPAVAILPGKGGLLNGSINGIYAAMAVHMLNALVGSVEAKGGVLTQQYFPIVAWPSLPSDSVARKGLKAERVDGAGMQFPLARHAYQAVAERVLNGYSLDVLLMYDANPVFEAPGGQKFVQAFEKIPFIVSFSSFMDESAEYADLVLPEPTFLERWQDDYVEGLGYPGIALRQPVIEPLYNTMNTGDFLLKVAEVMGGNVAKAFPWKSYEEVLQFRLAEIGTDWETLKNLGVWLAPGYRFAKRGSQRWVSEVIGRDRLNSPRDGYFDFFSRELNALFGEMKDEQLTALGINMSGDAVALPHHEEIVRFGDAGEYPFALNIITLMSLGPKSEAANLPTLQEISGMTVGETWNSWVEMNPDTAQELGLENKDMVWVESPFGKVKTKVCFVKALRPDVVNLPYNQGHTAVGRFASDRGVNGLDLLNPASEPASGLASFTNTRVKIRRA